MSEFLIPMAFAAIVGAVYAAVFIWHSNDDPDKEPISLHCGRCGLCPGGRGASGGADDIECRSKIKVERGNSNE